MKFEAGGWCFPDRHSQPTACTRRKKKTQTKTIKQCNEISTVSTNLHLNKCIFYGVYRLTDWVHTQCYNQLKCMDMLFNISKSIYPPFGSRAIPIARQSSSSSLSSSSPTTFRFNAIKIIIFQNVSRKPEILATSVQTKKWGKFERKKKTQQQKRKTVRGEREREWMKREKNTRAVKVKKLINQF